MIGDIFVTILANQKHLFHIVVLSDGLQATFLGPFIYFSLKCFIQNRQNPSLIKFYSNGSVVLEVNKLCLYCINVFTLQILFPTF